MAQPEHNPRPIIDKKRFSAEALFVAERIDTRSERPRLALTRPMIDLGNGAHAVLFRYGAVVLFNAGEAQRRALLERIAPRLSEPYPTPECEAVEIVVDAEHGEGLLDGAIVISEASVERLQVIAEILAKSVVLAAGEVRVAGVFDVVEPMAAALGRRGRISRRDKDLLRHIGNALLTRHKMVGRVEIPEKPELLWELPHLERLYLLLEDEYELRERHLALERKVELIATTAETLLSVLHTRRSLHVEWYIVVLIVVEILLTLYTMFVHGGH